MGSKAVQVGKARRPGKAVSVRRKAVVELDDVYWRRLYLEIANRAAQLIEHKEVAQGRHRRVFISKDGLTVYKVPYAPSGEDANIYELENQGDLTAETWLHEKLTRELGVHVIQAEFVRDISAKELRRLTKEQRDWAFSLDCFQVGYTADGRLVAYDWEQKTGC